MFRDDIDMIPRTYSVKSFRKRKTLNFGKVFLYLSFSILLLAVLGVALLSITHMI